MRVKKILVAVTGNEPVQQEAVKLACFLSKSHKAALYAVHVIEVKYILPLEEVTPEDRAEYDRMLEVVDRWVDEEDVDAETDLLRARYAGPAIVDEVSARGADLLVLGMRYKKKYGLFSLGEAVPYVLKYCPCPIILIQELPEGK